MNDIKRLSVEDKKQINSDRQRAVRQAWGNEKEHVVQGKGTRDWSPEQQKELIDKGKVEGYDGHHMKSVCKYPEQAGNPENIQFLSEKEHFEGAHQGNYHNLTNGYYNPGTGRMQEFQGDELKPAKVKGLSQPALENGQTNESLKQSSSATSGNTHDKSAKRFNESAKVTEPTKGESAAAFNDSAKKNSSEHSTAKSESQQKAQSQTPGRVR